MAYAIYKYELLTQGEQLVQMPRGARLMSIQNQAGKTVCWAIVNPDEAKVARRFLGFTTGGELPNGDPGKYIATVMYNGGSFVLHWFDAGELKQ